MLNFPGEICVAVASFFDEDNASKIKIWDTPLNSKERLYRSLICLGPYSAKDQLAFDNELFSHGTNENTQNDLNMSEKPSHRNKVFSVEKLIYSNPHHTNSNAEEAGFGAAQ